MGGRVEECDDKLGIQTWEDGVRIFSGETLLSPADISFYPGGFFIMPADDFFGT